MALSYNRCQRSLKRIRDGLQVMANKAHDPTLRMLADPNFPALFRQLEELARISPEAWEARDYDPIRQAAVAVAFLVLNVLGSKLPPTVRYRVRAIELHVSRDGGVVVIAGNSEREVELAIGPEGAIGYVVVDLRETEPARRYLREGEIAEDRLIDELPTLFA